MTIEVNNSGTWTAPRVYINNSGTWTEPNEIHVNDSGTWKLVYKKVDVTSNTQNININTLMGSPSYPLTAVVNISGSLTIGSSSTSNPAITTSGLPAGSKVFLIIGSGTYVVGAGGAGGDRVAGRGDQGPAKAGGAGGLALYTRVTTYLENNGTIGGGGGGGGGGSRTNTGGQAYDDFTGAGGGGAGNSVGPGVTAIGPDANNGTLTTGGAGVPYWSSGPYGEAQYGSIGGDGGDLGQAGSPGVPWPGVDGTNSGGAAGNAIDGVSYITKNVAGTITGGEVN